MHLKKILGVVSKNYFIKGKLILLCLFCQQQIGAMFWEFIYIKIGDIIYECQLKYFIFCLEMHPFEN